MLVLTRVESERIKIGDDIVITLVKAANGKARIGIEAPRQKNVVREELVDGGFGSRTEPRKRGSRKPAADCVGVRES